MKYYTHRTTEQHNTQFYKQYCILSGNLWEYYVGAQTALHYKCTHSTGTCNARARYWKDNPVQWKTFTTKRQKGEASLRTRYLNSVPLEAKTQRKSFAFIKPFELLTTKGHKIWKSSRIER
eukprot:838648-Amphidinium_carterae.1